MPTPLRPLPAALPLPVFSAAEALAAGVTPAQLRGPRFARIRRGLITLRGAEPTLLDVAHALCRLDPDAVAIGPSAASLWGFPLPRSFAVRPLHLATHPRRRPASDDIIHWRRLQLDPADIACIAGVRLTSRVRTWADLAGHLDLPDLIVVTDHLIRLPRPALEGRSRAHTTLDELARIAQNAGARRDLLAAALHSARIGADSPQETRLRMACIAGGLPEPQVNAMLPVAGGGVHQPDLLWHEFGVCAEYDGGHHLTPEQFDRDIRRRDRARRCGLVEIAISRTDMRQGAHSAVQRIRGALIERGWKPVSHGRP